MSMARIHTEQRHGHVKVSLLAGVLAVIPLLALPSEEKPADNHAFTFQDVGEKAGLFPHASGIQGHAAGWGDADGDGWIDLYVGTFAREDGKNNLFFRNSGGKFELDGQKQLQISTRASAALFADLDNDGDLDLYVSSMPNPGKGWKGCTLFRNDGEGKFTDVSADNGACPPAFGGRSAAVLDYDGDGLLDLLVGEDPLPRYNGSATKSSRLFRNTGNLQFEDVSRAAGIPPDLPGLGVAAGDVNNDGWPDLFLASNDSNALFLNDGKGKFREAPESRTVFAPKLPPADNLHGICGVCFGDVNRDGLLDVVIGHHYGTPWLTPVANRLYLNRGIKEGVPAFEDVTERAGLKPLPMKAPHVELQDFDNDGLPDLYISIVMFEGDRPHPVIFKNHGVKDGVPQFREDALGVNDFPTEADRAIKRSGPFFTRMIEDKKVIYMAPGPSGDFDNDGKLDLFLPNWWVESRSLLLRNETPGGNWLRVEVEGGKGVNRMGVGSRVNVYPAGKLGEPNALLGCREISTGYGYASGQPAYAHFGLGKEDAVDVEVILPHGKGTFTHRNVAANKVLKVTQ
jgi:hypothetical protein